MVYEAYDRQEKTPVALKVLRFAEADALYRFKKSVRSLADVRHPNLVTVHGLESVDGWWFLIMDLVAGTDFVEYLRGTSRDALGSSTGPSSVTLFEGNGSRPEAVASESVADGNILAETLPIREPALDYEHLRDLLSQLARGLHALHQHGRLHRDIKPSNVMVTREGRVVLLDFGLVTELERLDMLHSGDADMVGTPAYMAPEQAEGLPLGPASDWYSIGVMLYQSLTGQLPFSGSLVDVLHRKRHEVAPDPREYASDIPQDLTDLCVGLLHTKVAERLSGDAMLERLGAPGAAPASTLITAPVRSEPTFVGRRTAVKTLHHALRDSRRGAVTVYVRGPSGVGKTALIHHFLGELRQAGSEAVVLMGRCFLQESVPYKALDSLIDALSRYLMQLPQREVEVLLPVHIGELARLFPVLRRVAAVARQKSRIIDVSDPQGLRRRGFAALRELLARLAQRRTILLFIDDLQWGDVDSFSLLEELLRPPDPPALLLVGCYRSEDEATSPFLNALDEYLSGRQRGDVREIDLGHLSESEAREMLRTLEREGIRLTSRERRGIIGEGGGSPLFLSELVNYWCDQRAGSLEPQPDGTALTLHDVILARFRQLPEAERRLLEVVAVAGKPLDLETAGRAADVESGLGLMVERLHGERLVRRVVADSRNEIEAYHDRIREAVVESLDADLARRHHHRLATVLEATGHADAETLAVHFRATRQTGLAREYAIQAAEQAEEALAFERSARLYRLALELTPLHGHSRYRLQVKLGHALAHAGRGREAAESLLQAVEASGTMDPLEAQRDAAEQLLISGHIDRGLAILRHVLRTVGMRLEEHSWRSLANLRLLRFRLGWSRWWGREWRFRERPAEECDALLLKKIDVCWSVEIGLCLVDVLHASEFHARHLVMALKAGETRRIARALAMEVFFGAMERSDPRPAIEAARRLAARLGDRSIASLAEMASGLRACVKGKWHEANRRLEYAEEQLLEDGGGLVWELDTARHFRILARLHLGQWSELFGELPRLLKHADQRGDRYLEIHLRLWVESLRLLAVDRPEQAAESARRTIDGWSHHGFHFQHFGHLMAESTIALYEGRALAAYERVAELWPQLEGSMIQRIELVRIQSFDLRARSAVAAALESRVPARRARLLARAWRDARRIEQAGSSWAVALAALLRAGILTVRGLPDKARVHLEKAEAAFLTADMPLHAAVARWRRARSLDERQRFDEADAFLRDQGIERPERIVAVLAPGEPPVP